MSFFALYKEWPIHTVGHQCMIGGDPSLGSSNNREKEGVTVIDGFLEYKSIPKALLPSP